MSCQRASLALSLSGPALRWQVGQETLRPREGGNIFKGIQRVTSKTKVSMSSEATGTKEPQKVESVAEIP